MAFDVYELYNSRKVDMGWDQQSADLIFYGRGELDDDDARAGFLAEVPATFFGLFLKTMNVECIGGINWICNAKYESTVIEVGDGQASSPPPSPPPPAPSQDTPLGPEYTVDLSAVTEKITQSKETRHRVQRFQSFPGGIPAPDNQRAIGITADGEVEGCERVSPRLEWTTTRAWGYTTLGYWKVLYSLVGKTNDDTFYGWARGEVLFLGASSQTKSQDGITTRTYKFAVQPNETDIVICDSLEVPDKRGWDYLWVAYESTADVGKLTQQPFAAYVERIYGEADFELIRIGS